MLNLSFIVPTRNILILLAIMSNDYQEINLDTKSESKIPSILPVPEHSGTHGGSKPKRKTGKDRRNPRGPKSFQGGKSTDNNNNAGPKSTLQMHEPIVIPQSVPPPQAQLRNQRTFQSIQTCTLLFLMFVLEKITEQKNMVPIPPTYLVFPISFDGNLFSSLIVLAIGVKAALVASAAVGFKLPHKLGRMYSQILKACTPYFTVARGVVFAQFFGFFSTPLYETTYPSFLTGATSFIILSAYLFLKHINNVYRNPSGWCRDMSWGEIFPTANGSKAHSIDLDEDGMELDTWFGFLTPNSSRPNLHLLPTRPFVDHEDFRLSVSGYAAAAIANTFGCSVFHKGKMINAGSHLIIIHERSRDPLDTYFYENADNVEYCIAEKELLNTTRSNVEDDPMIDPITNAPHAAGNRFTGPVALEHVLDLLEDLTNETCTRAASVYYDSSGADVRTDAVGCDIARCEALLLMLMYGGYTMFDSNFLNAFGMFDALYYSDGTYYQNTSANSEMDISDDYLKTFYDLQTFILEIIRGQFTILSERYLAYFKAFKIKVFKVIVTKMTGSPTQLYSYLKTTSNGLSRLFTSPFVQSDNHPTIEGSHSIADTIVRNDIGFILAPSINVERTVACTFAAPEGKVAVAQYMVRKPWDNMSSNWNEPPPGLL